MYELIRTETRSSIDEPFFINFTTMENKSKLAKALIANDITTNEQYSNESLIRTVHMYAADKAVFDAFLATPELAAYFVERDAHLAAHNITITVTDNA